MRAVLTLTASGRTLASTDLIRARELSAVGLDLRSGRMTAEQGQALWQAPDREQIRGKRDRALLGPPARVRTWSPRTRQADLRSPPATGRVLGNRGPLRKGWSRSNRTIPVPDWVHGLLEDDGRGR